MASITVTLTISAVKPSFQSGDVIAMFTWLATLQTAINSVASTVGSFSCSWNDTGQLSASIIITQNKASFAATDLDAINTWIQTNIVTPLPSNCRITRTNTWVS